MADQHVTHFPQFTIDHLRDDGWVIVAKNRAKPRWHGFCCGTKLIDQQGSKSGSVGADPGLQSARMLSVAFQVSVAITLFCIGLVIWFGIARTLGLRTYSPFSRAIRSMSVAL